MRVGLEERKAAHTGLVVPCRKGLPAQEVGKGREAPVAPPPHACLRRKWELELEENEDRRTGRDFFNFGTK